MSVQVPKGYQQTEVGVTPENWIITEIGAIASVTSGGTPNRQIPEYWGGSIPWVTTSEINSKEIFESSEFITDIGLENSAAKIFPAGTLLMAIYGQGKTRGKVAFLGIDAATNQACVGIHLYKNIDRYFVFHSLEMKYEEIRGLSNSGSQENLSGEIVKSIKLAIPTCKKEQKSIAEALSDADALIESLEQLIVKKRQIKQGAMQELLTGQRRLPGFSGEWELKKLKDFGSTYGGLTGKTKSDFGEGSSHYITFMNVMSNIIIDDEIFELVNVSENESQNNVMMGDLLFNGSSETPEELGFCSVVNKQVKNVYLNSFCFGFRFKEVNKSCGLYFAYFFRSKEGRELLKSLAQGATRYNLSKTSLLNLSFRIPSLDEQIAIADVLSELDAEVSMIQSRLSKARQIKQAMMQELLTGRIRLI